MTNKEYYRLPKVLRLLLEESVLRIIYSKTAVSVKNFRSAANYFGKRTLCSIIVSTNSSGINFCLISVPQTLNNMVRIYNWNLLYP